MRYTPLLLLFVSCTTVYVPNTRNTPLFREQGEAQISGFITSGGLEGQGAYALTDHLAVIGSYTYGKQTTTNSTANPPIEYDWKNSFAEIGIGYFDRSRSARYELFAGYGIGEGTSLDQYSFFGLNNNVVATGKRSRIFVQPSIGTNNRNFNIAFTPRLCYVNMSEFTTAVASAKPKDSGQFYVDPAFTAKFRLAGNLHGLFQLGLTVPVPGEVFYEFSTMQVALGIQIDTGGLRTRVY
jgi:hypothetical protein